MRKWLDTITPWLVVTCGAAMAGWGVSVNQPKAWAIGLLVAGSGAVIAWAEDV